MSKLASRWASEEALVNEAIEQDEHVKHTKPPLPQKSSLPSKWASAPLTEPESKPTSAREHFSSAKSLPTPPRSADGPGRLPRKNKAHSNVAEVTSLLADRLDVLAPEKSEHRRWLSRNRRHDDVSDERANHSSPRDNRERPHSGRAERSDKGLERSEKGLERSEKIHEKSDEIHGDNSSGHPAEDQDVLYEKGPMTDAAMAFALRIGAPQKGESSQRDRSDREVPAAKTERKTAKETHKYLTPRQKRELAAQQSLEQERAANAVKEARLQQEVKEMFEKMSDTSTSWADFEDE